MFPLVMNPLRTSEITNLRRIHRQISYLRMVRSDLIWQNCLHRLMLLLQLLVLIITTTILSITPVPRLVQCLTTEHHILQSGFRNFAIFMCQFCPIGMDLWNRFRSQLLIVHFGNMELVHMQVRHEKFWDH